MLRRAGDEDPEGFAVIVRLIDAARAALPLAAGMTRRAHGYSYTDLAFGLGVTRQSAAERFHAGDHYDDVESAAAIRAMIDGEAAVAASRPARLIKDVETTGAVL